MASLMDAVVRDKEASGAGAFVANRYPVRFVLFDNFRDCYEFVSLQTAKSLFFQSIDLWLNPDFPDSIVSHSDLATRICDYISKCSNDSVITPFSELARFYNNKTSSEFNALIATIKAVESSQESYDDHRRVYIPIVGLYGKMSKFSEDTQSTIWYLKSSDHQLNYNLILTDGQTFGVKNIEEKFTLVKDATEWLSIWQKQEIKQKIVCTSRSIYANAEYAQPDNAFDYTICDNVYKFLTEGLCLSLGFATYKKEEDHFWRKLASEIDVVNFNFTAFFNAKFGIFDLADFKIFYRTWFDSSDAYSRWLLSTYYTYKFCDQGYICRTLKNCSNYTNAEFVQNLLLTIFDLDKQEEYLEERNCGLLAAQAEGIVLPENIQDLLYEKLLAIEERLGCRSALKYVSCLTDTEKKLVIQWLTDGKILANEIRNIYPDLFAYLSPTFGTSKDDQIWSLEYIDEYKKAKLSNTYSDAIKNYILAKNADEVSFNSWFNDFQTVRTIMCSRSDINVYFWIDGLGMEWIPFISSIVEERNTDGYYLNDVIIARAGLPTATENNKVDLQKLAGGPLQKDGDLDSDSHKIRPYPSYIIADMKKLRDSVNMILDENPGKKIAIISDHGISYMPQLCPGLNLMGITGDHGGRYATWNSGAAVSDEKYKILDDKRTICALRHESLTAKIKEGSGCHGGCTPEEVLVPIFIISDYPINSSHTISLKTLELSAANPVLRFTIKGLSNIDVPYVIYNELRYSMKKESGNIWATEPLPLVQGLDKIALYVGAAEHVFKFKMKFGVEEDDLFD